MPISKSRAYALTSRTMLAGTLFLCTGNIVQAAALVVGDQDFYQRNAAKEALGKFLMFDKILSGNQNISCATCHHPLTGTGDGLSLPVGEGGTGLGVARNTGAGAAAIHERVPRNAPPVFNLGAREFTRMFHDGRVAVDSSKPGGFVSPAAANLPAGLDNVLAAQAMFPVTSSTEMAGQAGENTIADAAAVDNLAGPGGVWEQLAQRLRDNAEYAQLFINAFDDVNTAQDIQFTHAANAIAAFEASAWRCTDSLFDKAVQRLQNEGNSANLSELVSGRVLRGADIFYGKGQCGSCHSGPFQTDHQFHALGVPQIGPGKGDEADKHGDFGRERVTRDAADRFKFRTPSLRQVAFTGPWGHDGAFNSLEAMVRHHLNPQQSLQDYSITQAALPPRGDLDSMDSVVQNDAQRRQAIADAVEVAPVTLTEMEIKDLMVFLNEGLTDYSCVDLRHTVPVRVPSGLPVAD